MTFEEMLDKVATLPEEEKVDFEIRLCELAYEYNKPKVSKEVLDSFERSILEPLYRKREEIDLANTSKGQLLAGIEYAIQIALAVKSSGDKTISNQTCTAVRLVLESLKKVIELDKGGQNESK